MTIFCMGCETIHTGPGYVVHDDKQSMDFAWVWYKEGNLVEAKKMSLVALNLNPESIDALTLLGLVDLKQGNFDTSIEYLEKAKGLVISNSLPDGDYTYCKLGLAYYHKNEFEKALEAFNDAKKVRDAYGTEAEISITLWKLDRKQEAVESLKRSKQLGNTKSEMLSFLKEYSINMSGLEDLLKEID